jgi:hypothetical protein
MNIVLVESPYAAGTTNKREARETALHYAAWCMADSCARGEAPIASHLLYTLVYPEDRAGREQGLARRDELACRVDVVALYTDIGETEGMQRPSFGARHETRTLDDDMLESFLSGEWPPGSIRPVLV